MLGNHGLVFALGRPFNIEPLHGPPFVIGLFTFPSCDIASISQVVVLFSSRVVTSCNICTCFCTISELASGCGCTITVGNRIIPEIGGSVANDTLFAVGRFPTPTPRKLPRLPRPTSVLPTELCAPLIRSRSSFNLASILRKIPRSLLYTKKLRCFATWSSR